MSRIGQDGRRRPDGRGRVVRHQIAHQAHEDQVHRAAEGLADAQHPLVVEAIEVVEPVQAASGEEALGWAGRVAAVERLLEHVLEREVGRSRESSDRPVGEAVGRVEGEGAKLSGGPVRERGVEPGDRLEVRHQRPQLR